jgi:DeoR/GlpR family transcriptional regulator of sugar metabolism
MQPICNLIAQASSIVDIHPIHTKEKQKHATLILNFVRLGKTIVISRSSTCKSKGTPMNDNRKNIR